MKCDVIYCKTLHTRLGHFYNIVDVVNTQIGLDWAHVQLCNTSIRRKCRRDAVFHWVQKNRLAELSWSYVAGGRVDVTYTRGAPVQ